MQKITKTKIATGIYWVEAPEADLRVLCGCPADSVKLLMKRGLMAPREKNGLTYETGPNAILLSDVLVQNGNFANLAEFPLLQMLYRQGMILPNHPNNTGAKPLLIGSKHQVQSQMQYIYRGNYGLVTEEEMLEAGLTPERAHELMRLKLKFAFGKIRPTNELLDSLFLDNNAAEIRNSGVFVRRTGWNTFEFKYQGETITIDLNLSLQENYEMAFSMGFYNIKREYFEVIHSGEGDGWDPNRQSVSSILVFQGRIYLIDANPNFLASLQSLGISVNEIEGIFHTHSHDDHFAGLPTLMRSDKRIKYFATPLVRTSVAKKVTALLSLDEEHFYDYFEVQDLEFDIWNDIDGLEVKPILSPHPVETNIFLFRALWNKGYHTYAHYEDLTSFEVLKNMVTDDDSKIGISQEFFDTVKKQYLQKVDLKKIDIGGGIIHGEAEDFRDDPSEKILLTHVARKLTDREKEIGSGAPFGTFDTLIPAQQNYTRQYALQRLEAYFPTANPRKLAILLNNPVVTFNPESLIFKSGVAYKEIYIVLTGNVEMIQSDSRMRNMLSAGAFVGEINGLFNIPLNVTYRAASFVQALKLNSNIYLEFVKQNNLYADLNRLRANEQFLQTTWLFNEAISYPVLNRIAKAMEWKQYPAGHEFSFKDEKSLFIIKSGLLERFGEEDVLERLQGGDFFGEEEVLYEMPSLFRIKAMEPVEVCQIPGEALREIPIVRWKLYETFEKRKRLIMDSQLVGTQLFVWRDEYNVNIEFIDLQHLQLMKEANIFYNTIESRIKRKEVQEALDSFIHVYEFHFSEEERCMKQYDYPGYEVQHRKHAGLISDVQRIREKHASQEIDIDLSVFEFLKNWLIDHILTEDRKLGQFLRKQGLT